MDLIDDQGRIFGLVNVVDALVVLLVAVVVIAGVAFILQPAPKPEPETGPEPPELVTTQVTLQLTDVPPYLSDAIHEGMTAVVEDRVVARITDVERAPATVVVTDQEGVIHLRQHPINEDLTLVAALETNQTDGGYTFQGEPIQIGGTVTLGLGNVTIQPTVTSM